MDDCQMLSSIPKITPACTHITELCQQVFTYKEEADCASYTSCAQVLQLPQSHISDNRGMITYVLYPSCFWKIWGLCIYICIYIYIYYIYYIYIYNIYIWIIPVSFLSPYNHKGKLFSMLFSDLNVFKEVFCRLNSYRYPKNCRGS